MNLLRRLTFLASRPGELDALPGTALGGGHPVNAQDAIATQPGSLARSDQATQAAPYAEGGLAGMMAVNLIRAHREELMQASSGKLDHMVIDVVGSLFDQILSDPRVPPQMARQIARLQLPVLRVAMNDATFFSSRRHPVRRFVNRIASLACAFDEFDDGPGRAFLARVRELVQEIVEGDFDQIELYTAKLAELEAFIGEQTQGEVQQSPAAATLESKESELRIQQRYMLQLSAALKPMQLPEYLRDFLSQVWSQALVLAVRRDGPTSERFQRFKRAGRDVVMSMQPKGSPVLRKRFLMQLPQLMKDLNEGMALIGWPEAAQKAFFAQLLPAHAESLKSTPLSELDHNMMAKALEGVFNAAVPGIESLSLADEVPTVEPEVIEKRFTEEEAKQVGLVAESAVDWSGRGRYSTRCRRRLRSGAGRHHPERPGPGHQPRHLTQRAARASPWPAADGPHQAGFRLPDAPQGRVAEGSPHVREPGTQLLRLLARQEAPGDHLDDRPHARAHVRDGGE